MPNNILPSHSYTDFDRSPHPEDFLPNGTAVWVRISGVWERGTVDGVAWAGRIYVRILEKGGRPHIGVASQDIWKRTE